jgi:hypothetical protein
MGWHKRQLRAHLVAVLDLYNDLDFETFTGLLNSFFGVYGSADTYESSDETQAASASTFAQRLITGAAAEGYPTLTSQG